MKVARTGFVAAFLVAAATFASGNAFAQGICGDCGAQVAGPKIDQAIRKVAQEMGLERTVGLLIGEIGTVEYVANGTMVDLEAATLGAAVPVSRFTYNVNMRLHASRLDFQSGNARTIRVVKDGKAWNETWSADGKKLATMTVGADVAAVRTQLQLFQPQVFITAAAFASGKMCFTLEVKDCTDATATVGQENGKTVITLNKDGNTYKGTVSATNRIQSVEGMIKLPSGTKRLVATYPSWRAGEVAEVPHDVATGAKALDKFHSGVYWPEKITWDLDGARVLDLTVTEGWNNPYTAYLDPEVLAQIK
jgi:hypothetical protein